MPLKRMIFAVAAAVALAAIVLNPGIRERTKLVGEKLAGDLRMPWVEVVVRLAPWSQQSRVRRWLGSSAEPWIEPLDRLALETRDSGARAQLLLGPTPNLLQLDCHLSVLDGGKTPHPPHTHVDEELIVPIEGEVEIVRGESFESADLETIPAGPGSLVYHASERPHTIRAAGPGPSRYFVLRWMGESREDAPRVRESWVRDLQPEWDALAADAAPSAKRILLDDPTLLLGKLHVHLSRLAPGDESAEHVDMHDVVMITVEGVIETLGERVEPSSAVFHPAHVPHAIRNVGEGPARYLVIEFHAD